MSTAVELLYGQRDGSGVETGSSLDLEASNTLVIEAAEILYVLFEARMEAVLAQLPSSLHPSIPAVLGATFIRAKDGPLGPFEIAWAGLACRTGIKPRHFVQAAYTDSAAAAGFFTGRYGFNCIEAAVDQRDTYDRVRGVIHHEGRTLLDVMITESLPLVGAGALIKYSPALTPARIADVTAMVQFEAAYDFKRVVRGKPKVEVFDDGALGIDSVSPTHPIAGSHAVCDLHLMPPRFKVDLKIPAEDGGATRIER